MLLSAALEKHKLINSSRLSFRKWGNPTHEWTKRVDNRRNR